MNEQKGDDAKQLKTQLTLIQQKLDKLEERYVLEGEITKEQFEKFSQKLKEEKKEIEKQMPQEQIKLSNLEKYLEFSLEMCQQLPAMWVSADNHQRQKLQKLVFPEGVAYDKENDSYRTPKTNSVFELISSLSVEKTENKKGLTSTKTTLSNLVVMIGIEPTTQGLSIA